MPTVPRVRDTLQITRLDAEPGEAVEYSISDREERELGRVTEEGYFLLLQMDGLTEVDQVCNRIKERFGKTTSPQDLTAWFEELRGAGVLNTNNRSIRVLTYLREQGELINVKVGNRDVVVAYDQDYDSIGVFYNDTGVPVEQIDFFGDTHHGRLSRVETLKAGLYWFIWCNFFPKTDLNRAVISPAAAQAA